MTVNASVGTLADAEIDVPQARGLAGGRLYRYRRYDPNELRLLVAANQIRFSDANYFNDPFDFRPRFQAPPPNSSPEEVERHLEALRRRVLKASPEATAEWLEKIVGVFRRDPSRMQQFFDQRSNEVLPIIRSMYPLLCLSESSNVPLLWAHYADSHQGLCMIFDVADSVIAGAFQVVYADEYPAIQSDEKSTGYLIKTLLTKPKEWSYEREYRVLAREGSLADPDAEAWHPTSQYGFVELSSHALIGVILGARMGQREAASARGLLGSSPRSMEIWSARLSADKYLLQIEREK